MERRVRVFRDLPMVYGAMKLDEKDKKILRTLEDNARYTLAQMSKLTNLPRDVIAYRIKKLVKDKVIAGFSALLCPPRMGFPVIAYVCFSLHNLNKEQERKFISYLVENKHVSYVGSISGKWDYIIDIMAKDPDHLTEILKDIRYKFSDFIRDYEIFNLLNEFKYEEIAGILD